MRLGDLDAIEKFIENGLNNPDKLNAFGHDAIEILAEVHYAPTIDAVPVVRCKDCDNHSESNGYHYCKFWRMYCPDDSDFFCKAGERKDGDGNG